MKNWMLVASKEHVLIGVRDGFAQACHGKASPLKRMSVGDNIIYYSPKHFFGQSTPCQEFTAIGQVIGQDVYSYDMGNGFVPYRRNIQYQPVQPVPIKPLISQLEFIKDKQRWGYPFRWGAFEIYQSDFELITDEMFKKDGDAKV